MRAWAWASVLAACAAASCVATAAAPQELNRPSEVLARTPQNVSQTQPQISRDSPLQQSSQASSQMPEESPHQVEPLSPRPPPTKITSHLVTTPKLPMPHNQSSGDSKIQSPSQSPFVPSSESPSRPPPALSTLTPPKPSTQPQLESPTQPPPEMASLEAAASATQPPAEIPSQPLAEIPSQPLPEMPKQQTVEMPNPHPLPQPNTEVTPLSHQQLFHSTPISSQSPPTPSPQQPFSEPPSNSVTPQRSQNSSTQLHSLLPTYVFPLLNIPLINIPPIFTSRPLHSQTNDSGEKCTCLREAPTLRKLDCSSRNRSTIRTEDLCDKFTTHVDLSNNSFVSLPDNLGDAVRVVNLSHNLLTSIPRSPPLHPETRFLDLSFNRIVNTSDELDDMYNLRRLFVQGNRLQSLNFLRKACPLAILWADHNEIRSLEDAPFTGCFLAVEIDLSWNKLTDLPKFAFENLFRLTRVKLAHSGLTSIPAGVFGRNIRLELVDLSGNELTTLPSRAFEGGFAQTILLDNNKISSLPDDAFLKLLPYTIKKISLAKNKLENIPQKLFSELSNLEHLNLNQNYLRHLPNGVFAGLNLTEIGLQMNLLENLPSKLFSGLKFLKRINLGGNKLTSVPEDLLAGLSNLELLDLSGNQLTTVPPRLFNGVKSIEVLDLSFNRLSTFSGSRLEGLEHVEGLSLKGNQLRELPVFDVTWPQVVSFNLERNDIQELGEAAVRSWLGDGSQERRVTVRDRQWLRAVEWLRWAAEEPEVAVVVDAVDCRCGVVRRGRALLSFCAAVHCDAGAAGWADEALRSATEHTDRVLPLHSLGV